MVVVEDVVVEDVEVVVVDDVDEVVGVPEPENGELELANPEKEIIFPGAA